jgi:phosphoribosyl 1,2-cyclic phosphodiesterase
MEDRSYTLTFQGVRGSVCAPGPSTFRYGGETSCVTVRLGPTRWLILDCGTGLRGLRSDLPEPDPHTGLDFRVLLSHYHWDHIQGLPFFDPIYDSRCRFTFYGYPWGGRGLRSLIEDAIRPPWFPVSMDRTASRKSYVELDGAPIVLGNLTIRTVRMRHPQGVTAYRLEHDGGSVTFATDLQLGESESDEALISLCKSTDTLICDAQHTLEEHDRRPAHGHSTWEQACRLAQKAEVRRLVLFHHDPDRTDDDLDRIVARARLLFPEVDAARERCSLTF